MYQIIDCKSTCIIWEGENFDRAIEQFEFLQGDFPPSILFNIPDFESLILQKVERIDRWQK